MPLFLLKNPNLLKSSFRLLFQWRLLEADMRTTLSISKALNFGAFSRNGLLYSRLKKNWVCCYSSNRMENGSGEFSLSGGNGESRGALIVLEGLDRSGKTLQSRRLQSYLEGIGHSVELWRFPDRTTSVGQMISSYLSNQSQLDDRTIHLLFSANRWEKSSLMETRLKSGVTLIVDRYSYSGVAFSSAKGLDIEWCKAPEIGLLSPDVVLYLNISPEKAAERGGYGDERYEKLDFQRKVAQCYETLRSSSWKVIDACRPVEDIEKELQEIVMNHVAACKMGRPLSYLWS